MVNSYKKVVWDWGEGQTEGDRKLVSAQKPQLGISYRDVI